MNLPCRAHGVLPCNECASPAPGLPDELRERIDADMARAAHMPFGEVVGFLAGYTGSLELWRYPGVTVDAVRAYADAQLLDWATGEGFR
jgi:hypothetical protein